MDTIWKLLWLHRVKGGGGASYTVEDSVPYLFRRSAGGKSIGNREKDKLVGGTVAVNQLVQNGNFVDTSGWSTGGFTLSASNNVLKMAYESGNSPLVGNVLGTINGHKYFTSVDAYFTALPSTTVFLGSGGYDGVFKAVTQLNTWVNISGVFSRGADGTDTMRFYPRSSNSWTTSDYIQLKNMVCIDLTQMFGTTIADYIYTLEQGTAGAGVAFFKSLFPEDYYPYNEGELLSVKATAHKMVGFNQWDEEWEVGTIDVSTGQNSSSLTTFRSKNYIEITEGENYYLYFGGAYTIGMRYYDADKVYIGSRAIEAPRELTYGTVSLPTGTHYVRFVNVSATTYNHDICINLSKTTGTPKDGDYEAYSAHTYPLDSSLTLRGIPKLDASNNLYYDGDVYEASGKVTRKFIEYTIIGNETVEVWHDSSSSAYSGHVGGRIAIPDFNIKTADSMVGIASKGYQVKYANENKTIYTSRINGITIINDAYTTREEWLAGIAGTTVVMELATPTTETADPFASPQVVSPGGTEEYVVTAQSGVEVPVGHETLYKEP